MPELSGRDEFETRLAKALARINGRHRRELIALLGDPPDAGKIDAAFWQNASSELQGVIAPILEEVAIASAEQMTAGLPIGVDWGLVNEGAAQWAHDYTFDLVRGLNDTTRRAVGRAVARYFEQGQTIGDLEAALSRILGPNRAMTIAVTEVTRAAARGEMEAAADVRRQGIDMVAVWQTNNDELVCPICGPLHGVEEAVGGGFTPDSFGFGVPEPPAHVNCLVGDTDVLPIGGISAGTERWFEGNVVTIETLENKLTVTPNHPILTPSGFVPARLLKEGDDVIGYRRSKWESALVEIHDENGITRVEQILGALNLVGFRVPTAAPDFHNDGVGSEVAIVRPNSLVMDGVYSEITQPTSQFDLFRAHVVPNTTLPSVGTSAAFVPTDLTATRGLMRCGHLPPALASGHLLPLERFGLGLAAGFDTSFLDPLAESAAVDPGLLREAVLGFSGFVTTEKVVKVGNSDFTGHVYNLQTDTGLYIAGGIITHNCRCWVTHRFRED